MPYKTPNGPIYDSGDFAAVLDKALAKADWRGFPARRAASEGAGKLRGIGIGCFLEVAGGILEETVELRFEDDGTVARAHRRARRWARDTCRRCAPGGGAARHRPERGAARRRRQR